MLLVGVVGVSPVHLGVHHVSDALGGWVLGVLARAGSPLGRGGRPAEYLTELAAPRVRLWGKGISFHCDVV